MSTTSSDTEPDSDFDLDDLTPEWNSDDHECCQICEGYLFGYTPEGEADDEYDMDGHIGCDGCFRYFCGACCMENRIITRQNPFGVHFIPKCEDHARRT
jgi:hypothetical protein